MKKNLVIVGAGGFGREVQWLIERINSERKDTADGWNLLGYIDDGLEKGTMVDGLPVLGKIDDLRGSRQEICAACAIGRASVRHRVISLLMENEKISFPNLIDPSVKMSGRVKMGKGNILCAGTILTVDIEMGDFNLLNLDCTVGHDVKLASFVTVYPSVNISGNVTVEEVCELGTGTQILQGKRIGRGTTVGAGAVVIEDLPGECVAVGVPAAVVKKE